MPLHGLKAYIMKVGIKAMALVRTKSRRMLTNSICDSFTLSNALG